MNDIENRTISDLGETICRFTRFIRTSGKYGGKYVDGSCVLNVSGNCGQRLSFDPGKQYEGVVTDDSQPAIGEPFYQRNIKNTINYSSNVKSKI